jgi:hypothetical protein
MSYLFSLIIDSDLFPGIDTQNASASVFTFKLIVVSVKINGAVFSDSVAFFLSALPLSSGTADYTGKSGRPDPRDIFGSFH